MAFYIAAALAAFILIGAGIVATIAAYELRGYIETRHSALGQQAAAVLADGGRSALEDWLRNAANIPPDVDVYILDDKNRDVLDRAVPAEYVEFIRRSDAESNALASPNYRPVSLSPKLLGTSGELYTLLILPESISLRGSTATGLGLGLAGLLVIAIVAWLIARTFGKPIVELQMAVRQLAAGDTDARVPSRLARRQDELGTLAADFNSMADQLSRLIQNREQLLREMSHELRSPLARIEASLALSGEKGEPLDKVKDRIRREIATIDNAIGEMQRYSRLDATTGMSQRLLRIDRLLGRLVDVEKVEADASGCRLELRADNDLAVVGDPKLLRSGIENIVRNAIRFAPDGSVVEIEARRQDKIAKVVVGDRGPGVPAEHLEHIFEPYFRVHSGKKDSSGSGLGLAIAQRVFEVHGGSIVAEERPGGGLNVIAKLPLAQLI